MAAPGGPDKETWNRMSSGDKLIYWVFVIVAISVLGIAFVREFFL